MIWIDPNPNLVLNQVKRNVGWNVNMASKGPLWVTGSFQAVIEKVWRRMGYGNP